MNSSPYVIPAFLLVATVLLACIAYLACTSLKPAGRHSRPARRAHAAQPFADPADTADPDGEQYVEQLTGPKVIIAAGESLPDWWDVKPPPGLVLAEPGLPVRQPRPVPGVPRAGGGGDPGLLARMRDALLPEAWRPEPGEVTFTPADPGATRFDLQPVPDVIP